MNRAISFSLALVAIAPAACSSTGGTQGASISYSEQAQNPPPDTQEAPFNLNGPMGNSNAPLPNADQPASASAPGSSTALDSCPMFCRNIDSRCAARCAQTCAAYNTILVACPEVAALIVCVGNIGLSCTDTGRLRLPEAACTSEATSALPCLEQYINNSGSTTSPPPGTITPGPAPVDSSSNGGGSVFDGGR